MNWTEKQLLAIKEQNHSLLVSAAAGSGKTAVLIERIKKIILEGRAGVDELLVVTFTKAAASEMKEKLIAVLKNTVVNEPENSEILRKQLDNIYKSSISTFHSFALDIVRRYFYVIDIDPGISICDEAEAAIMESEAMDHVFETHFEENDEEFLKYIRDYSSGKSEENLKDDLKILYAKIQSMPKPFQWLDKSVERLNLPKDEFMKTEIVSFVLNDIENSVKKALSYFEKSVEILENAGLERLAIKAVEDLNKVDAMRKMDFDNLRNAVLDFNINIIKAGKDEKKDYEEIKETVKAYRKKGKTILMDMSTTYFALPMEELISDVNKTYKSGKTLYKILKDFHSSYRNLKKEKNLVDFNDIEHFAIEILQDEKVSEECKKKYKFIFIDEYQDSNYLQEAIIDRIRQKDNVFMVGDIKQSIYSFRLAEPDIFKARAKEYSAKENDYGIKIDLNQNFRSKKNIINAVNDIFENIMEDYDEDAALNLGIEEDGGIVTPVEMILVDGMQEETDELSEEIEDMKNAELEAIAAAKLINNSLGKEIYDTKEEKTRAIEKKDIVILMRGVKGTAEIFRDALKKQDIDVYIDDNSGYFDTIEILTFTDLLRVIDNSRQDIPLLSVLRSPIFGFSIEDLIKIKLHSKYTGYRDAVKNYGKTGEDVKLAEKSKKVIEKLSSWKEEATITALDDFIWKLMRETDYYLYVSALPGGRQRQTNLRALVDKTASYCEKSDGTLYSLLRYIDATGQRKIQTGQISMVADNADVVRIMSIHKSKGLEYPMVIVAGLGKRFNFDKPKKTGMFHKDIGFGISLIDRENHWRKKTLVEIVIENKKRKEELEEEVRILYVAMTRARDYLVLMSSSKDMEKTLSGYESGSYNESCYLDLIFNHIDSNKITIKRESRASLEEYAGEKEEAKNQIDTLFQEKGLIEYEKKSDNKKREKIFNQLSFKYPYANEEGLKSKYSVSELNSVEKMNYNLNKPLFAMPEQKMSGAEKGTIMHIIMEHLDFAKAYQFSTREKQECISFIKSAVSEMVKNEILTEEEKEYVDANKIVKFFNSNIGKRIGKADKIFKEKPFNFLHDLNGSNVIVQGVIDCYFQEGDKLVLLDYKTNYTSYGIEKKYQGQIELYRKALEVIEGKEVKDAYLYLFTEDKEIKM